MKTHRHTPAHCRGVTLVELMVAMLIGLVLIGGLIQVFMGTRESYRLNESVSRLQENGRFAIDAIARDLRMAGLPSCLLRQGIVVNLLDGTPPVLNLDEPLDGWEAADTAPGETRALNYGSALAGVPGAQWSTVPGTVVTGLDAMPGADILRIRRMEEFAPQVTNISPGAAQTVVTVTQTTAIDDGDLFVMCNGNTGQAYIVQGCNVQDKSGGPGITLTNAVLSAGCVPGNQMPVDLGGNWGDAGQLSIPREVVYFVGKRTGNAANAPSLFRRVDSPAANGIPDELVEGVESLQVLYGVDTTGDQQTNDYLPANLVPAWDQVVSVRIGLLLVSTENNVVPADQDDILLLGTTFTPPAADRRLRQTMTATVTLRNRAP